MKFLFSSFYLGYPRHLSPTIQAVTISLGFLRELVKPIIKVTALFDHTVRIEQPGPDLGNSPC